MTARFAPRSPASFAARSTAALLPGDHHLVGRIEIRRLRKPRPVPLIRADGNDRFQLHAQNRRHRAYPTGTASCMYLPRLRTVRTASVKDKGSRGHVRGIFPQAVSCNEVGVNSFLIQHPKGSNRNRQNRGLSDLGEAQLFFRALKAELREFVAESGVGFLEGSGAAIDFAYEISCPYQRLGNLGQEIKMR